MSWKTLIAVKTVNPNANKIKRIAGQHSAKGILNIAIMPLANVNTPVNNENISDKNLTILLLMHNARMTITNAGNKNNIPIVGIPVKLAA